LGALLETEDVVWGAHPILAAFAVVAFAARNDLFSYYSVPDFDTPASGSFSIDFDYPADEFMTRYDVAFGPRVSVLVAPELRGSVVALQITCADATGFDFNEGLAGSWSWNDDPFKAVVLRPVTHDGIHGSTALGRGFAAH
jgi:hypothetical protein